MNISIIFSADYDMQILAFIKGGTREAWDRVVEMEANMTFKAMHVTHYDVAEFISLSDLNAWIEEQVAEGRSLLHSEVKAGDDNPE